MTQAGAAAREADPVQATLDIVQRIIPLGPDSHGVDFAFMDVAMVIGEDGHASVQEGHPGSEIYLNLNGDAVAAKLGELGILHFNIPTGPDAYDSRMFRIRPDRTVTDHILAMTRTTDSPIGVPMLVAESTAAEDQRAYQEGDVADRSGQLMMLDFATGILAYANRQSERPVPRELGPMPDWPPVDDDEERPGQYDLALPLMRDARELPDGTELEDGSTVRNYAEDEPEFRRGDQARWRPEVNE